MLTALICVLIFGVLIGMIASYFEYKTWGQIPPAVMFGTTVCLLVIAGGVLMVVLREDLILPVLILVGVVGLIAAPAIILSCFDKKRG